MSLGWSVTQELPKQKGIRLSNGGLHQVERNALNSSQEWATIDCEKQTQIPEEIRKAACVPPLALLPLLLTLPYDSTFLPGPAGESHFPFSHMNIHKRPPPHRAHSGLVGGRLLVLAGTFLYSFNSTEHNAFVEAIVYVSKWTLQGRPFLPPDIQHCKSRTHGT